MDRFALEIIFVAFMVVMGFLRYPFQKQTKNNVIDTNKKDAQEKCSLALTFLGMSLLPLLHILSPWLDFVNYQLPTALRILGIVLLIPTAIIFYRSHRALGKNWSVSLEIREEHSLVTHGIYKRIRHPMYTAIWLWVICQALLLQNYIAGLSGIVGFGLLIFSQGR